MEEERKMKVIISKSGGNSGAGGLNYKISIPSKWAHMMDITKENREVTMIFDGEKIVIVPDGLYVNYLMENATSKNEILNTLK